MLAARTIVTAALVMFLKQARWGVLVACYHVVVRTISELTFGAGWMFHCHSLWDAVLVSGADYLIRPKFAGGGSDANTLLVPLSFVDGVKAFGVIGIFVGLVMLSLIVALLRIVREERLAGSLVPVESESRRGARREPAP